MSAMRRVSVIHQPLCLPYSSPASFRVSSCAFHPMAKSYQICLLTSCPFTITLVHSPTYRPLPAILLSLLTAAVLLSLPLSSPLHPEDSSLRNHFPITKTSSLFFHLTTPAVKIQTPAMTEKDMFDVILAQCSKIIFYHCSLCSHFLTSLLVPERAKFVPSSGLRMWFFFAWNALLPDFCIASSLIVFISP